MLLLKEGGKSKFQQIEAKELAKMFGVPFKKLEKTSEFLICPERIIRKFGQSSSISHPTGTQFPANFFFKYEGKSYELRYAEDINQVEKGGKYVDEYAPRKVVFNGANQLLPSDNMDKVVYFYLYPLCKNSPFVNETKSAPHWYFKDAEKESQNVMDSHLAFSKAIASIQALSGDPLRIVARAFNITGTEQMQDIQVQSLLVGIAQNQNLGGAEDFNKKMNSQVHTFKGITRAAIDKGTFVSKTSGLGEWWTWGKGPDKGNRIVEIHDNGTSKDEILVEFINENIQEYYPLLIGAMKSESAESHSEKFLKSQPKIDLNKLFGGTPEEPVYVESEFGGSTDDILHDKPNSGPEINPALIAANESKQPINIQKEEIKQSVQDTKAEESVKVETKEGNDDDLPDFMKPKKSNKVEKP